MNKIVLRIKLYIEKTRQFFKTHSLFVIKKDQTNTDYLKENKNITVRPYQFRKNELEEGDTSKTNIEEKQPIDKKTKISTMILVVCVVVMAVGIMLVSRLPRPEKGEDIIAPIVVESDDKDKQNTEMKQEKKQESPEYLKTYIDKNPSTVGYIKIGDTAIDYPVVQTDNNDYYIDHNFDYTEDKGGAIFLDFRCDVDDFSKTRNMIIYGHRMKDGSMFKGLLNYQDEDFFLENRIIQFDTINESLEWKVFSVFETTTDFYYIDTEFPYDEMWLAFLEQCKELSLHQNNISFYKDDIVLTLSTCTMEEDGRFVVMAKLIK